MTGKLPQGCCSTPIQGWSSTRQGSRAQEVPPSRGHCQRHQGGSAAAEGRWVLWWRQGHSEPHANPSEAAPGSWDIPFPSTAPRQRRHCRRLWWSPQLLGQAAECCVAMQWRLFLLSRHASHGSPVSIKYHPPCWDSPTVPLQRAQGRAQSTHLQRTKEAMPRARPPCPRQLEPLRTSRPIEDWLWRRKSQQLGRSSIRDEHWVGGPWQSAGGQASPGQRQMQHHEENMPPEETRWAVALTVAWRSYECISPKSNDVVKQIEWTKSAVHFFDDLAFPWNNTSSTTMCFKTSKLREKRLFR